MSILDIFNLTWKPREGIIYRNKVWGRHKSLVWLAPMWQGQPPFPIGKRRQNISKVYVELDKIRYPGSFQVKGNVCTFGILNYRHITELYKTDRQNVKFFKRYTGKSKSTNIAFNLEGARITYFIQLHINLWYILTPLTYWKGRLTLPHGF